MSTVQPVRNSSHGAFTLLELITAILIISILTLMVMPLAGEVQKRLERTKCMGNLRGLHIAAQLYVQEHRSWPQLTTPGATGKPEAANKWINALRPYDIEQANWICPTIQHFLQGPDLSKAENVRVDYTGINFDPKPMTPYQWPNMPWFIENANMHGNGNLLVFSDGRIQSLYEIKEKVKPAGK